MSDQTRIAEANDFDPPNNQHEVGFSVSLDDRVAIEREIAQTRSAINALRLNCSKTMRKIVERSENFSLALQQFHLSIHQVADRPRMSEQHLPNVEASLGVLQLPSEVFDVVGHDDSFTDMLPVPDPVSSNVQDQRFVRHEGKKP